jgi:hypothetical protein
MIATGLDDCMIYIFFCEWMVNSSSSYANKNLLNKNVDIKSSVHGDLTLTLLRKQLLLCHLNTACLSGKFYYNLKLIVIKKNSLRKAVFSRNVRNKMFLLYYSYIDFKYIYII